MSAAPASPGEILVVDDQPQCLLLLLEMLQAKGYQIRPVPSGRFALQVVERTVPDLILLDIFMPDLDGFAVCRRIRGMAALHATPIIFLSASGSAEDRVSAFQCGGVDYIAKPFQPEEVEARVATHLRLARFRREQEALNRELDLFAHTAAHDLRAPLQHMVGTLDELAQDLGEGTSRRAGLVADLLRSAQGMGDLIEALLDFAQSGQAPLRMESVDLDRIVQACLDRLEDGIRGRRVRWRVAPLPRVWGDPSLLAMVVQNLLDNAVKFTRDRVEARIEVAPLPMGTGFLVRDDGPGFDPARACELFKPFTRLHRLEGVPGSGLGLAHVKRIVDRHGGRVWAQSDPGSGATFHVFLPEAR
jgi:two-component system, sensor histidine kinase and response regulator